MPENTPAAIIERLHQQFLDIYANDERHGSDTFARQMLEEDIFQLGQYFGAVDPLESRTATALLAECVATLRVKSSPLPARAILEQWIEQIMQDLLANPLDPVRFPPLDSPTEVVERLQTLRKSKDLLRQNRISALQDTSLRNTFLDLANLFLLRDGNVTAKEMEAIRQFETALAA